MIVPTNNAIGRFFLASNNSSEIDVAIIQPSYADAADTKAVNRLLKLTPLDPLKFSINI